MWFTILHKNYNKRTIPNIISSLKSKNSAGNLIYHEDSLDTIIPNKSLSQDQFPSAMKLSKIYAEHKNGCKMKTNKYRPISLIRTYSKVIERVVLKRIIDYCDRIFLPTNRQHDYLKRKFTLKPSLHLWN